MKQQTNAIHENRLMTATLFVFFVSGASSVLMGNLMPFLRETYGISYAQAGLLLSLPSWGNLASIFITGYLPTYIGRRKTVLLTACWMAVALWPSPVLAESIKIPILVPLSLFFVHYTLFGQFIQQFSFFTLLQFEEKVIKYP